ncbi:MAG: tetratricopeptide repeat protein [Candidatus Thorarchaeota archaeon]|nr:tetratricopeptide repeat protein [Candidatus Thorarchaeota archaeon]
MTDNTQEDLNRALALCKDGEYERSLEIAKALVASKGPKDPMMTLDALILEAEISWRTGKLDEGLSTVEMAEDLIKTKGLKHLEKGLQERRAKLFSQAGVIHWYMGNLDRAMEYHEDSLRISQNLGDKVGVSVVFNNLGLVLWTKGDLDRASEYYKKSIAIYEELNDENGISRVLNNLANISSTRGELDQALSYHLKSLEIKKRIASKQDIATSLINVGVIHRLKGNLEQAAEYYNKSLTIQQNLSIGPEFALALNNLGEIHNLKGNLDSALEFYQRSFLIYEAMGAKEGIALTLLNIGDIQRRKGNNENAFEYYQRSLAISEGMGNTRLISAVLGELVALALDSNDSNLSKEYLTRLEQVDEKSESAVINQQFRISNALILKHSPRTRDRVKAEEILERIVSEEVADHTLTIAAMIHLCDLLLLELKATRADEVLKKVNDLTKQLMSVAQEQASHPLVVESYLLQSKLALIDFEVSKAKQLLVRAKNLADEKGLFRLSHIVDREIQTLQNELQRWESILEENPSKQEMVNLTNLDDLVKRMVLKTVESLGIESTAELRKPKYKLIHKDMLVGTDKSERGFFRVGIAQMGLSKKGDILNEIYEEKVDGLIGLREESIEPTRVKVRSMIEKAHSDGINVLLFPEMTIDLSYVQLIQDLAELAKEFRMLIIPGSFHDQESKRNLCRVFSPEGILWEQEKHIPAIIHINGKRFMERIDTATDAKKAIICNTEFGRIAIAICRDFLDMDLRVELKNSDPPVDLVINPAFTPVTEDFKAAHFDARRSIYAYCFFANVAEFGESLIYTPEKERIERNIPKGEEGIIYKDVNLFQLRSERKKWEELQKQRAFIQSTR